MSDEFRVVITNIETGSTVEQHDALDYDSVLALLESYGVPQAEHLPYGYTEINTKYATTIVDACTAE